MEAVVAKSFLSFRVQKVWELLDQEYDRIKGVDEYHTELKYDFEFLMSFLEDADAKKHANQLVKSCVEQVREITFDIQDIIETFILKEELRKTSGTGRLIQLLNIVYNIVDRMKFASAMQGISKRISKVTKKMMINQVQQKNNNGRQEVQHLIEKQREIRKTFPSNNENDLVGLDENVKKLVGYLVEEDNIWVVSITGMGGIGKTTLAQQVINHEMVSNYFDGVVWVCLSQQFTRKDVWETIFKKFSSKHDEQKDSNMTEDELQDKLLELLKSRNSLIVLDDIWEKEHWDIIKHVFPSKHGGKILLTSRNEQVALHIDPKAKIFKAECLSKENSWTLFKITAFSWRDTRDKVDEEMEEMEEMGKKMIQRFGGLPLGVKVLGGLLATKYTLSEWKMVFENIEAYISGETGINNRDINSVYNILYLSFEELPIYLKHCFLYLAHFPEDYDIDVGQLSYLWAADGISRPRCYGEASIREVGDKYIEELVNRNMVIPEKDVITSRFKTCRLHDMMREVCLHKAKEENFLQTVDITSITKSEDLSKSRRVAVHCYNGSFIDLDEIQNLKLRSLLKINKTEREIPQMKSHIRFERLQLMRVLDISFISFEGDKIPSSIEKLIHLRYLNLYKARVSQLPSSMQNLKKLIYLNLHVLSSGPIWVPNFMKDMRELAYLSLPSDIDDGVHLELGNLVNLETLENLSTKNSTIKDFYQMTRLKRLSINYNGGCTMEVLSSSLCRLSHLEDLKIKQYGQNGGEEFFVLDCVNLKQLEIYSLKLKLPLQHLPPYLTTIKLWGFCLKEDPMPILEKLLQLKEVELWNVSLSGSIMVCSKGGFPQLQKLDLDGIKEWEEWIVEEGSMPLLHTLCIQFCRKLKQLPDGLRFITSLKSLDIAYNDNDNARKDKLLKGGDDYYKVQHIPHRLIS